jgi:GntR family negative regulator for fad regulon and positive regulator of fabA
VEAILRGRHPAGSALPAERALAVRLGVTRPTLREALQRLHRDGWLSIQQGRETRVRDVWREGGLNVLSAVVRHGRALPRGFVAQLLEVRTALAPAYARAAVTREARAVSALLEQADALGDDPASFVRFDWQVHHALAVASGNPIYALILNGFAGVHDALAGRYFAQPAGRRASRAFYGALRRAARQRSPARAETVTRAAMVRSARLWARVEIGRRRAR